MRDEERSSRKTGAGTDDDLAQVELILKNRALDASAEGITIADARQPDQPLIYVNRGFERITGYTAEEVLGRNCRFLQGADTDVATVDEIRRAINEGRECVVELLNHRKDGQPFWNRLSITPVTDSVGNVTHFVGVQSDITARRNDEKSLRTANAKLEEANRRIGQDLEMAAQIQRGFLPQGTPEIDGLEVAWELHSCDELAGDTLNVLPLDGRHVEFYAIDVSGHGVSAALLSVTLNHMLSPAGGRLVLNRSAETNVTEHVLSPVEIAKTLNRQFPYDFKRNQFFTIVYGVYDTDDRLFRFVTAGQPPPIHVTRSGETQNQWVGGIPIGIQEDFNYEENTIQLAPGDRVYLYSDGLIEAFDQREEPFGVERLVQALKDTRNKPLKASVRSVIEEVEAWGQKAPFEDDVSVLAFEAR